VSRKAWVITLLVAFGIAAVYVWGALAQLTGR
jgi:hypothetical protein